MSYRQPRQIQTIVIHCADTYAHMDIGAAEIRQWHVDGNGWSDIGYHYVIRRNGVVELGRDEMIQGAHVRGHNHDSIGVCLVGGKPEANFTPAQWAALRRLLVDLRNRYPWAEVYGHRDFDPNKECPMFDVCAELGYV